MHPSSPARTKWGVREYCRVVCTAFITDEVGVDADDTSFFGGLPSFSQGLFRRRQGIGLTAKTRCGGTHESWPPPDTRLRWRRLQQTKRRTSAAPSKLHSLKPPSLRRRPYTAMPR